MQEPITSPVEEIKEAIDSAVTEIEEHTDEAEKHEELRLHPDDIRAVADAVYDKSKKLISDLLDAAEDAAEMAMEDIETPAAEEAPAEEATEDQEPVEDVKPKRSHPLFRKPMRRED